MEDTSWKSVKQGGEGVMASLALQGELQRRRGEGRGERPSAWGGEGTFHLLARNLAGPKPCLSGEMDDASCRGVSKPQPCSKEKGIREQVPGRWLAFVHGQASLGEHPSPREHWHGSCKVMPSHSGGSRIGSMLAPFLFKMVP